MAPQPDADAIEQDRLQLERIEELKDRKREELGIPRRAQPGNLSKYSSEQLARQVAETNEKLHAEFARGGQAPRQDEGDAMQREKKLDAYAANYHERIKSNQSCSPRLMAEKEQNDALEHDMGYVEAMKKGPTLPLQSPIERLKSSAAWVTPPAPPVNWPETFGASVDELRQLHAGGADMTPAAVEPEVRQQGPTIKECGALHARDAAKGHANQLGAMATGRPGVLKGPSKFEPGNGESMPSTEPGSVNRWPVNKLPELPRESFEEHEAKTRSPGIDMYHREAFPAPETRFEAVDEPDKSPTSYRTLAVEKAEQGGFLVRSYVEAVFACSDLTRALAFIERHLEQ